MIIVTGGAGMIGSNIVEALNERGIDNILVVDHLKNGTKVRNLADLSIADYMEKDLFLKRIQAGSNLGPIEAVFHEGACSDTMEGDGQYMMFNNYEYSKELLHYCLGRKISFLYASSAATYGNNKTFIEEPKYEGALNVYGYSKQQFDNYVRRLWLGAESRDEVLSQVVGLRYFNAYGPRESHKGTMASVIFHLNNQLIAGEIPRIFEGSQHFARDFVYVKDICEVNLWFMDRGISGIFNCGTGSAEPFERVAEEVARYHGGSVVGAKPFPEDLQATYQEYTRADLNNLRAAGCDIVFKNVGKGIQEYLQLLNG